MKRSAVWVWLLMLCVVFCGCGESSSKPQEVADVPNIDHNILDADRHLGNSYENYSSEDTLLVEYGNRIYHAYNSRYEIMEYCTENDKTQSLGIYGTNLSVYKNVLYYIGEDGTSIHAFDLETRTDSIWITGEEVDALLPAPTYQYPQISDLIVTEHGMCMLCGGARQYLMHLSFEKTLVTTSFKSGMIFTHLGNNLSDLVIIAPDKVCALYRVSPDGGFCIYDLSEESLTYISSDPYLFTVPISCDGHSSYFYSLLYPNLLELSSDSLSLNVSTFFKEYTTHLLPKGKHGDYIYFSILKPDNSSYQFLKKSLTDNTSSVLIDDFAVTHLTFSSNNTVYGITANNGKEHIPRYFKADIYFQNITYLD